MAETTSHVVGEALPDRTPDDELRLHWSQTESDREAHFTARAPAFDSPVGCIFRTCGGADHEAWTWSITADDQDISRSGGPMHGVERSPRQAARQLEAAWFRATVGSRFAAPAPLQNAYAEAKMRRVAA